MEKTLETVKLAVVLIGGFLVDRLGGWDVLIQTLIMFMGIDIITGFAKAKILKQTKSQIMWVGGIKKIVTLSIIAVAVGLDSLLVTEVVLRSGALIYFIANEGLSILENARSMGIDYIPKLNDILNKLKGGGE